MKQVYQVTSLRLEKGNLFNQYSFKYISFFSLKKLFFFLFLISSVYPCHHHSTSALASLNTLLVGNFNHCRSAQISPSLSPIMPSTMREMNFELSLLATFDSNRTFELVFIMLSLEVKVLVRFSKGR